MTAPAPRRRRSLSPATRARRGLLPHQVVVTVNVSGSAVSEQDLVKVIRRQMQAQANRNWRCA